MDITQILIDFAKIVLGGIIGGGIVAWIEYQRFRRQQAEWALSDKKLEMRIIEAMYVEYRWLAEGVRDKDEQLRIYKSQLDSKLREWDYLVKVSIINTTSTELLVLSAELEISQFDIRRAKIDEQHKRPPQLPFIHTYHLMTKSRLYSVDFPVAVPPKSSTGFAFLGGWFFDAPNLVETPPSTATFTIKLDDKSEHKLTISFEKTDSLEVDYLSNGEMLWAPHAEKFADQYKDMVLPF